MHTKKVNEKNLDEVDLIEANFLINNVIKCHALYFDSYAKISKVINSRKVPQSLVIELINSLFINRLNHESLKAFEHLIKFDLSSNTIADLINDDSMCLHVKVQILKITCDFNPNSNTIINLINYKMLALLLQSINTISEEEYVFRIMSTRTKNILAITDKLFFNEPLTTISYCMPNYSARNKYFKGLVKNQRVSQNLLISILDYFGGCDFAYLLRNRNKICIDLIDKMFIVLIKHSDFSLSNDDAFEKMIDLNLSPRKNLLIKYCNCLTQYQITKLAQIRNKIEKFTYYDIVHLLENSSLILSYIDLRLTNEEINSLQIITKLQNRDYYYDDSWPLPF